jgi:hypothetical protein
MKGIYWRTLTFKKSVIYLIHKSKFYIVQLHVVQKYKYTVVGEDEMSSMISSHFSFRTWKNSLKRTIWRIKLEWANKDFRSFEATCSFKHERINFIDYFLSFVSPKVS